MLWPQSQGKTFPHLELCIVIIVFETSHSYTCQNNFMTKSLLLRKNQPWTMKGQLLLQSHRYQRKRHVS
jgi:hypothetical protein